MNRKIADIHLIEKNKRKAKRKSKNPIFEGEIKSPQKYWPQLSKNDKEIIDSLKNLLDMSVESGYEDNEKLEWMVNIATKDFRNCKQSDLLDIRA